MITTHSLPKATSQKLKFLVLFLAIFILQGTNGVSQTNLTIAGSDDQVFFQDRGVNVLVFNNWYNGLFSDSKISGVEIIHHGVRTATNGDVRLDNTPEQWDAIPSFIKKDILPNKNRLEAHLEYPDYNFQYSIQVDKSDDGILLKVNLKDRLPDELVGRAGFNLEFLPSSYFEKSYLMDETSGSFPLYPSSDMTLDHDGETTPMPLASGKRIVLAPEDPQRRVSIECRNGELSLYDGRDKAQNGWFVVRTLIPADATGNVIEWEIKINSIPNWTREPMIAFSQVGYHPSQEKIAVIELDKNAQPKANARLLRVTADGEFVEAFSAQAKAWGDYLRYHYLTFDFSSVTEPGIYAIEYDGVRENTFRIAENIYENIWHPTLDVFFPVQMDHVLVNEAYRVWHGAAHLDDALQAPVNHEHFDLYAQGPTTDTKYEPGEHIPGLDIGGWLDAGDFDIRTQTQYYVVSNLVQVWEQFELQRDQTTVNQETRYVDIHNPDGMPDLLQQIEHGALGLIAQHRAIGHALPGIIVPDISQYTHLGDALTMTDNRVYNPKLDSLESDGFTSGTFDDRWAFTSKSTPLNYGSIAALTAASRALAGYNDELAQECLSTAVQVWEDEHSHEPDIFHVGNTTGGRLEDEELKAATELLVTTRDQKYADRINELWPVIDERFESHAALAVRAMIFMDGSFAEKLETRVLKHKESMDSHCDENPFCVPITTGGWAGSGRVIGSAMNNYYLHGAFPEIIGKEYIYRGLNYIFGNHPGSNISLVSGVGTKSKKVAYGMNRADFSFIAGGVVPGVLIIKPDFPENKEDWPFFWGENEYVISVGSSYLFLANAVNQLIIDN